MFKPALGLAIGGCLAMASLFGQSSEDFKDWPVQWVETYTRFENYINARNQYWPESGLQIHPDGSYEMGLPYDSERMLHKSLVLIEYSPHGGGWSGGNGGENTGSLNTRDYNLLPGLYAALVKSSTSLGYQHHEPIIWFAVEEKEEAPAKRNSAENRHYSIVEPPLPGEQSWPHQRGIDFLDFHIFTDHRNPHTIIRRNELVVPRVELKLHNDGVIRRELFNDEAVEKLLSWRIYNYNALISKQPASGQSELNLDYGPGSYRVFVVVEGPSGYLPVSNVLTFPLFPDKDGGLVVKPTDSDSDGTPDFVEELERRKNNAETLTADETYLLKLWPNWDYEINSGLKNDSYGLRVYPAP